uniref:Peroxidase mlt-7-like n=1 Tax=Phallusia mammillata TaxID=59560 RepID=A0A6F9DQD3_9ASCI|nr:peroxidase mlt-7-like [Phallusia mammillata]
MIRNFALIVTSLMMAVTSSMNTVRKIENPMQTPIRTTRECAISKMAQPNCHGLKYPTADGTCNNKANAFAGAGGTPFKRLIPPVYSDGKKAFRLSHNGGELPAARTISNTLNNDDVSSLSSSISALHPLFGQFLAHDIVHARPKKEENGVPVNCMCYNASSSCINVPIGPNDPHYGPLPTCIPLEGSITAQGCDNYPAEQVSTMSSYIDGTTIYGLDETLLKGLRDPNSDSGELLVVRPKPIGGCPFLKKRGNLPTTDDFDSHLAKRFSCPKDLNPPGSKCFVSGDVRANENIGLSSMHLTYVREHNRIARRLKSLNSMWDSDTVFHETRRIISAYHQIVTYNEYLPPLVGRKMMKKFDLDLVKHGFYYGYDASVDATIANEFTTAAFRYGHSMVGKFFDRPGPDYTTPEAPKIPMFKGMFQQEAVVNGTSAAILRGMSIDPAFTADLSFVTDLRNRMFESSTKPGQDLFSINIQRGREHGLPPYNDYREFCGLPRAVEWDEFSDTISSVTITKLKSVYSHVDDVDLYVGGLAEHAVDDGAVGPVFACLLAYQFRELRKGDRFWHENPGQFTLEQLQELRKVRQSKLFCDNLEGMTSVAPYVMLRSFGLNERVSCDSLPGIDLTHWKQYDGKQDSDWTRWILTGSLTMDNSLLRQRKYDPDSVCENPLDAEMTKVSESTPNLKKVRYLCPKGSLRSSAFPDVKLNLGYYWTEWLDRDSPSGASRDDVESLSDYLLEHRPHVCPSPLYIQAQTKDRVSALETGDVFEVFTAKGGLICRGAHQESGRCHDYRVRFYCPKEYMKAVEQRIYQILDKAEETNQHYVWSPWINLSTPSRGNHDVESVGNAKSRGLITCSVPLKIEARVAGTEIPFSQTGDVLKRFSVYHGLLCDNRDQVSGRCHDFEVRYLCPPRQATPRGRS